MSDAGWATSDFGSLFKVNTPGFWGDDGGSEPNILVLRSTNFKKDGGLNYETAAPRRFDQRKLAQKLLLAGDLILERSGGSPAQPVGRVNRFDAGGAYSASNFMQVLRPDDRVDSHYAYYLLDDFYRRGGTENLQRATTGIRNLDFKAFLETPVLVPPLDEQRRIAEVLRSSDVYIAAMSDALSSARAAKNAALIDALSNGWPETTVADLLAETRYPMRSGPFGSALLKSELQAEGIPFLGIDNVQVERFVPTYRRFISEEKYQELARYTVFPGDVMVTIMGTVGRCCVVPQGVGTAISSKHVWTITLDRDRYSPALLAWQINHAPWVLDQLRGESQGGIMSAINSGTLRELVVPIPPPPELHQIEDLLLSFNKFISATETELERAQVTKAALAGDLLAGRVRVPA